jgi:hypothetical protein
MTILFKAPGGESQRAFLPLLLASSLLLIGTAAIAAESAPTVLLPSVLTIANSGAESAEFHAAQPMPKQSITMPEIGNWQNANARVKKLGGWMFYASEVDAGHDLPRQPSKHHSKHHSKNHPKHHHADKTPKPATPVKDQS